MQNAKLEKHRKPHIFKYLQVFLDFQKVADDWYVAVYWQLYLGEREKAIDSLNRSFETKTRFEITNFIFPFIGVDPIYDSLHDEPRYQELLRKLNLP